MFGHMLTNNILNLKQLKKVAGNTTIKVFNMYGHQTKLYLQPLQKLFLTSSQMCLMTLGMTVIMNVVMMMSHLN